MIIQEKNVDYSHYTRVCSEKKLNVPLLYGPDYLPSLKIFGLTCNFSVLVPFLVVGVPEKKT